jgi:nucleosome assembly protein 1-like 1
VPNRLPTIVSNAGHVADVFCPTTEDLTAASIFAKDPRLVSLIQGRLGALVGRSSGYIESLPTEVKRRVAGLKGLQKEHAKLEAELQEEILALEKKYFAKFTPLYEQRAAIVNGKAEPTEEQVKAGEEGEEETESAAPAKKDETPAPSDNASKVSGIPEFWLSAMKNQISLAEMITDRDEGALKSLVDIRMEYLDKPGFRLIFEFAENEYFTNKILTKTYYYQTESGYGGDFIYDHAEGDKIDWKPGQDLTVRVEQKKQRNKSTCPSFSYGNFLFKADPRPQPPSKSASLRRPFPPSPSSTSSPRRRPPPMTMTTPRRISRSVSSSTTNSARISRRS